MVFCSDWLASCFARPNKPREGSKYQIGKNIPVLVGGQFFLSRVGYARLLYRTFISINSVGQEF